MKGPQAPVYFVAITRCYLALRRDWRYLFSWQYAVGVAVFVAIVAAWQIPFYLRDRLANRSPPPGPASPPTAFASAAWPSTLSPIRSKHSPACCPGRRFWSRSSAAKRATCSPTRSRWCRSWWIAFAVAYPTVWIAAGARGRYFMPLYPLVAVLIGLVIERCSIAAVGRYPRRAWHQFLLLSSALIAVVSAAAH